MRSRSRPSLRSAALVDRRARLLMALSLMPATLLGPPEAAGQSNPTEVYERQVTSHLEAEFERLGGRSGTNPLGVISDPRGNAVGLAPVLGMIDVREHWVAAVDEQADRFDELVSAPRAEKWDRIRRMEPVTAELGRLDADARSALENAVAVRARDGGAVPSGTPDDVIQRRREAVAEAEAELARANEALLTAVEHAATEFPEISAFKDGVPLWKALAGFGAVTDMTAEAERGQLYNDHVRQAAGDLRAEGRRASNLTLEQHFEFGGARYRSIREGIRQEDDFVGSSRKDELMDAVEAEYDRFATDEEILQDKINLVMLGLAVIAVPISPWACAVVGAVDVGKSGAEYEIAVRTVEQARQSATLTGERYVVSTEQQAEARAGQLVVSVVFVAFDAAEGALRIAKSAPSTADEVCEAAEQAGNLAPGTRTTGRSDAPASGGAAEVAAQPAAIGSCPAPRGLTPAQAERVRTKFGGGPQAAEAAEDVESLVMRARDAEIPESEIDEALDWLDGRYFGTPMAGASDFAWRLMVAEMDERGLVLIFEDAADLEFVEFLAGRAPRNTRSVPTGTVRDHLEVAAKAELAVRNPGLLSGWSEAQKQLGREIAAEGAERLRWVSSELTSPGSVAGDVGAISETKKPLVRVLTESDVENMRSLFPDAAPAPRTGTPEPSAPGCGAPLVDERPPDWETRRITGGVLPDETPTVIVRSDSGEPLAEIPPTDYYRSDRIPGTNENLSGRPIPPTDAFRADRIPPTNEGLPRTDPNDPFEAPTEITRAPREEGPRTERFGADEAPAPVDLSSQPAGEGLAAGGVPRSGAAPEPPVPPGSGVAPAPQDPARTLAGEARVGANAAAREALEPDEPDAPVSGTAASETNIFGMDFDLADGVARVTVTLEQTEHRPPTGEDPSRTDRPADEPPPTDPSTVDLAFLNSFDPTPFTPRILMDAPVDRSTQYMIIQPDLTIRKSDRGSGLPQPGEALASHVDGVSDFGGHGAADLIVLLPPTGSSDGAPEVRTWLRSLGVSTGDAFELVLDGDAAAIPAAAAAGLAVEPVQLMESAKQAVQKELEQLMRQNPVTATIRGYCLEFTRTPPAMGQMFRIAGADVQKQFAPLRGILKAGDDLFAAGMLNPDSDPIGYMHSIKQWALWASEEGFDLGSFGEAFVDHTRKNFEAAGREWSGQVEDAVRGVVPNRWNDIEQVLTRADMR